MKTLVDQQCRRVTPKGTQPTRPRHYRHLHQFFRCKSVDGFNLGSNKITKRCVCGQITSEAIPVDPESWISWFYKSAVLVHVWWVFNVLSWQPPSLDVHVVPQQLRRLRRFLTVSHHAVLLGVDAFRGWCSKSSEHEFTNGDGEKMYLIRTRRDGRPGWLSLSSGRTFGKFYPNITGASGLERYWVGGTATWDATAGSKWSATDGGAGGSSVPDNGDNVHFTSNSTGTCTTSSTSVCRSIDCTGFTGTLSLANSTTALRVGDGSGGALTFVSGMVLTNGGTSTTISFLSTSNNGGAGWNVATGGKVMPNVTYNGAGGKWVHQSAMSCTFSTSTITLTAGTLDTNSQTISCGLFWSNTSTVRTLTLGSTAWGLNGGASGGHAILISATNLTTTSNTATFTLSASQSDINNQTAWNTNGSSFAWTGAGGVNTGFLGFSGTLTCANVTITGTASGLNNFYFGPALVVVTGNLTINGNSRINQMLITSNVIGTSRTVTCNGTVTVSNVDIQDIAGAGSASWNFSGQTNVGDGFNNSGITFPTGITCYWKGFTSSGSRFFSDPNWFTTSGGSTTARIPLLQDTARFDVNSVSTTAAIVLNVCRMGTIDCTSASFTTGFLQNSGPSGYNYFYGSLTFKSGMGAWQGGGSQNIFYGRGTHTITSAGVLFGNTTGWNFQIDCYIGTYTLQDAITFVGPATLNSGTLNTNSMTVTVQVSFSANGGTLTAGSTTFTCTNTSAGVVFASTTTPTISAASATVLISTASNNQRIVSTNNKAFGTLTYTVANSPGQIWLGAANYTTINIGSGRSFQISSASTVTVANSNINGVSNGYTYFPNFDGSYASTPDSAALSITGNIDMRTRVAANDWTPVGIRHLLAKRASTTTISYNFYLDTTGCLGWVSSANGSTIRLVISSVATGFTDGTAHWLRVTRNSATGDVKFYTANDSASMPSSWTQLGSTQSTTIEGLFDGTQNLEIGGVLGGTTTWLGPYYQAQIRNNILDDGTGIVFDADLTKDVSQRTWIDAACTQFAESSTNAATVTLNGLTVQGDGRITIVSNTGGSAATLATSTGSNMVYVTAKDITATPTNKVYALHSKSVSGNTGIVFDGWKKKFNGTSWGSQFTKDSGGAVHRVKRFDGSTWHTLPTG
jgi:hypothetical protein